MLESIYNVLLFVLAFWGAGRTGIWIVGRGWRWYWKVLAILAATAAVLGFAEQLAGGPKTDLRILTEILASLGTILALEFSFRHVADNRWRFAFVTVAGIFLYVTWTETIDRAMGTGKAVAPATITAPPPVLLPPSVSPARSGGVDPMCSDPSTTYEQRQILGCPN